MSDNFITDYKFWLEETKSHSWSDFIDSAEYRPVMCEWLKDYEYQCGINSSYVGQHFHSIHLHTWAHWSLLGAKPVVVKQFGKEVTLGAEYYVKKLEKQLRAQLQKSRRAVYNKQGKTNSIGRLQESRSGKRGHWANTLPKMKRIVPLYKDPGQLNQIINFAHEERERKPNSYGAKTPTWDLDFFRSIILLQRKATEGMEKELMMIKLSTDPKPKKGIF